ncbi:MAG: hypothetical protein U1D65_12825 [Pseudomonas sp.]|nr:hypothetical protein [Pseudomonas sp.]MDZ4192884.1 hypothetical protein [Pseudomonas sp.]
MSEKHTPGDWHVSELDATGEKSEYYIFIEPGVAVVERSAGSQYDMADAHLLAASKLMFEALELADAALSGANMNMAVVEKKVKAAIRKARGAS